MSPPPLRVAIVGACPYPVPQGSQVFLGDSAEALRTHGDEPHLVVYGYGYGTGENPPDLPIHRGYAIPWSRKTAAGPSLWKPALDLALAVELRRVVRRERIAIVDAHNYEALLVALTARTRPIVYHAHNAMADELPYYFRKKRVAAAFGRWLDRTFPKRADHVVVPHARLADYLIDCGCTASQVSVVPPPLDASRFEVTERGPSAPTVLYAGNLDAYQNLGLLHRAMKRVRDEMPDTELIIATGAKLDSAQASQFQGARVVPTPDFESLLNVLRRDAVFVCPRVSWSGYPIKLLNAMAAGLAIVCCQSAAHPLTGGHDGLVVPDNDEEAFAEAITKLLKNREYRLELGRNARRSLVENHDPQDIAAAIREIYESVLCERT